MTVRVKIQVEKLTPALKSDLYLLKVLGFQESKEIAVLSYPEELAQDVEEVFVKHEVAVQEIPYREMVMADIPEIDEQEKAEMID